MKYGELLELRTLPAWREHYLSYKKLKRLIAPLEKEDPDEVPLHEGLAEALLSERAARIARIEADFFALLEADLVRINAHATAQRTLLEQRVEVLLRQRSSTVVKPDPAASSYQRQTSALDRNPVEVADAYCECAKLRSFVHLNHEGIRKIVKKLDKNVGGPKRQPAMVARLASQPFYNDGKAVD